MRNLLKITNAKSEKSIDGITCCITWCVRMTAEFFLENIVKQDKIKLSEKRPNEGTKGKVISYL